MLPSRQAWCILQDNGSLESSPGLVSVCMSPNGTCAALVSCKEGIAELQIAVLKCGNDGPAYLDSITNRCA